MQEVSDDSDVRLMFVRDIAVVLANTHTRYCLLTTQADDDTNAMVVKTYGAGDYFGELALMTNQPRAATVRATGNDGARCLKLQRATFDKFAQGCKAILDERAKMYREEKERQKAEREAERARVRAEREAERARKAEEREEEKRKREREREEQRLAREAAKAARGVEKAEQAAEKKATEVAAAVAEAAPAADAQEEEAGGGTTDDSQPEDLSLPQQGWAGGNLGAGLGLDQDFTRRVKITKSFTQLRETFHEDDMSTPVKVPAQTQAREPATVAAVIASRDEISVQDMVAATREQQRKDREAERERAKAEREAERARVKAQRDAEKSARDAKRAEEKRRREEDQEAARLAKEAQRAATPITIDERVAKEKREKYEASDEYKQIQRSLEEEEANIDLSESHQLSEHDVSEQRAAAASSVASVIAAWIAEVCRPLHQCIGKCSDSRVRWLLCCADHWAPCKRRT